MDQKPTQNKQENMLLSILLNLALPVMFLKKGEQLLQLDSASTLVIALAFPTGYFFYDLKRRGKYNFISVLGFVSILMTGGIGLFELSRNWFIAKEGALPLIIGIIIIGSMWTRNPLVKTFLYNDAVFNVDLINNRLNDCNNRRSFNELMRSSTYLIAASFFISSMLQFGLAATIVTVNPADDKTLFNEQVGDMTWISYLVILVPSFLIMSIALWRLVKGIGLLTGLTFEEMMHPHATGAKPDQDDNPREG